MGESNTHEKQNASSQTRANAAKRKPKHKPTSEGLTVVESKRVGATATLEKLQGELEKVNLTNNESNDVLHALIQESRRRKRVACLTLTKYNVLRIVARNLGFTPEYSTEVLQQSRFFMCWSDTVLKLEQLVKFFNWQRSNHFPSMYLLCRKGHLGATIAKLRSLEPSHYRFYPRSWLMRKQKEAFRKVLNSKEDGNKYFIMKPNAGCQGRGIMLTKDPFTAGRELDNYIVQEYIRNPLLIEGKKFDLRVYVLLTSIRDPSIFIFEDGLVRICADPYDPPNESNIRNTCKHLTNYAVNKKNPNFVFNEDAEQGDVGNKRNFKFFNNWLKANGHDSQAFWKSVGDVVTKTILAAQPQLANVYNTCFPIANEGYTCFEVLGFDILVDSKLKPWLIEVNHTPSFATETPLDLDIKSRLLEEVWNIVDVTPAVLETDALREQNEFTRRSLPPWAKNHPIYSQYLAANPITPTPRRDPLVINPGLPSPSSTTPTLGNPLEVPSFVQDRREQENKKLRGFTRVYPSNDPFLDSIYQQIRLSALRAWSTKPVELKEVAPTTVVKKEPSPPSEAASSAPSPVAPAPEVEKSEEPKSSIPSDEGILAETDPRSMSRPKPTEEELLWLQNLQKKLDELSESDPKRSELETHRDE